MNTLKNLTALSLATLGLTLAGCGESGSDNAAQTEAVDTHTHTHADGSTHDDHANGNDHMSGEEHAHDEVDIDPATVGEMTVELAQGHGAVEAGKEMHLVVKLPYNDSGATTVRAWIGTEDRTLSYVGKGEYAPSHDDYDLHAIAPDPLPENAMWWIEIEKPDGTKAVGASAPIRE